MGFLKKFMDDFYIYIEIQSIPRMAKEILKNKDNLDDI